MYVAAFGVSGLKVSINIGACTSKRKPFSKPVLPTPSTKSWDGISRYPMQPEELDVTIVQARSTGEPPSYPPRFHANGCQNAETLRIPGVLRSINKARLAALPHKTPNFTSESLLPSWTKSPGKERSTASYAT
jgi:hypothetical protein